MSYRAVVLYDVRVVHCVWWKSGKQFEQKQQLGQNVRSRLGLGAR